MVDPIDDIVRQARQGSVSAIIQVLNEKLASSGIRTRAMFAQGILQLLCEAAKPEQLEQPLVIPQVQKILESLQPRNVRRVNINSRIVREQQLLWLDEIHRDPENQLLWSKEILLKQPHLFHRLLQDWKDKSPDAFATDLPKSHPKRLAREKQVFWRGLVGGASLSIFLLLLGWTLYNWLEPKLAEQQANLLGKGTPSRQPVASSATVALPSGSQPVTDSRPSLGNVASQPDPFAEAVRLAESTVTLGSRARTSAEWLDVASRWRKASDLMGKISPEDPRHTLAQDRVSVYRQNSEDALQQAQNYQE
ncbi:MAG: hypothetical protein HC772_07255 [Leptolyngbyaceae cyanobacterium CRU_2_3]|nr:hypothetical protein [Leptolyngbyaceae cyanobacterium CRU_2_3]